MVTLFGTESPHNIPPAAQPPKCLTVSCLEAQAKHREYNLLWISSPVEPQTSANHCQPLPILSNSPPPSFRDKEKGGEQKTRGGREGGRDIMTERERGTLCMIQQKPVDMLVGVRGMWVIFESLPHEWVKLEAGGWG